MEETNTKDAQHNDYQEVMNELSMCCRIATRLASLYPEDPKVWTGTVSERLAYIAGLLTGDDEGFKCIIKGD